MRRHLQRSRPLSPEAKEALFSRLDGFTGLTVGPRSLPHLLRQKGGKAYKIQNQKAKRARSSARLERRRTQPPGPPRLLTRRSWVRIPPGPPSLSRRRRRWCGLKRRPSHPRAGGKAALQPVSPLAGEAAHELRPPQKYPHKHRLREAELR